MTEGGLYMRSLLLAVTTHPLVQGIDIAIMQMSHLGYIWCSCYGFILNDDTRARHDSEH